MSYNKNISLFLQGHYELFCLTLVTKKLFGICIRTNILSSSPVSSGFAEISYHAPIKFRSFDIIKCENENFQYIEENVLQNRSYIDGVGLVFLKLCFKKAFSLMFFFQTIYFEDLTCKV